MSFSSRAVGLLVACVIILLSPVYSQNTQAPPNEISLGIIVVSSQENAKHVLDELARGKDFATLAKQESIDSTASNGGALGKIAPSTLRPELRDALKGISAGQVSRIVHTPIGFTILKIFKDSEISSVPAVPPSAAATGSVKYSLGIGGYQQALFGLQKLPKEPGWNGEPQAVCDTRKTFLADAKAELNDFLAPENQQARASNAAVDVLNAYFTLGEIDAYEGKMEDAVKQYLGAYGIANSSMPDAKVQIEEALGIVYLHKSEMENGVYRVPGDRCLQPMQPSSAYSQTEDSQLAIAHFLKYLEQKPDDLEVRWLINLAYMTTGTYPKAVPAKYLIPPEAFASTEDIGRFRDVAPQAGLNSFSMAGGVIVDDFDNDGFLDIVVSSFNTCQPLRFFHNNGNGTFTEQAAKAGLSDQLGGLSIVQADYNNDGCLDILVMRGAWEITQRRSLLRNNCDGTFTDVTVASGLAQPTSSQAAVWVDINNDGLLDLFVGNEGQPAELFLNKGDGTFQNIADSAGVERVMYTKGVTAADFDNDGYMDLYVSNLDGDAILYHNNHDNTFTDVTKSAGVPGPGRSFATWFFDYDNDGWPDIFVTSYFVSVDETARTYLGLPHNATTLKLYRNLRNGTFRDVTQEVGLDKVFMPMGANFGDIDNDGFPDIYLGNGNPSYASVVRSVLLHNKGGKLFSDVTTSSGTGEWHKGHGVAFADLENRGDEDIVFDVGGATPGDSHTMRVFENPGHGHDWITLKLVGVKTNRAAIGARINVTVENKGQGTRSISRTVTSGGSFGASPLQQHIGLGKDAKILDLEVWWPTSNTRQHFSNVAKDQFLEITEFGKEYAKLDRKPYRLGGEHHDTPAVALKSDVPRAKNQ